MRNTDIFLIIFIFLLFSNCSRQKSNSVAKGQFPTISDNISNLHISSFAEDAYGYIWIGTSRGLNKYNGYDYRQYFNIEDDSTSICSDNIQTIFMDSKNSIWIGTDNGVSVNRGGDSFINIPVQKSLFGVKQIIEGKEGFIVANMGSFVSGYNSKANSFEKIIDFEGTNAIYNKCYFDNDNKLWLISRYLVRCYDGSTFRLIKEFKLNLPINIFYSYLAEDGVLWLAQGNFMIKIDTKTNSFLETPATLKKLEKSIITIIYPYSNNSLLLKTYRDGLFIYHIETDELIHQSETKFPFKVPDFDITAMFKDSQENLWIGSHDQGFEVRYKYIQQFNRNNLIHQLAGNSSIISLSTDRKDNKLWMTSYNDELIIYNIKNGDINKIDLKSFFPESPFFQDKIYKIHIDKDGIVWLQTDAKILQCRYVNNKIIRTKTFFFNEILNDFIEDSSGSIWVSGTTENVYVLPRGANQFDTIPLFEKGNNYKSALLETSSNEIIICASNQNMMIVNPKNRSVREIDISKNIKAESFIPTTIYQDKKGKVWIGTNGAGLFTYATNSFLLEAVEGISCRNISSIIEDNEENLWIGTLYGLCKYEKTKNIFYTYYAYDGIGGNQFNLKAADRYFNDGLIFGGRHGLTIFNPVKMNVRRNIPLYFEDIKEHDNPIIVVHNQNDTEKEGSLTDKINLNCHENDISISYVALDYSEYPRVKYHYILEGFENQWIEARNNRKANYSNLPPGDYCFRVKITGIDDTIVEAENVLNIHIAQSPWLSSFAICIYSLLIISFITYINILYLRIKTNKAKARLAIQEKEQEAKVNKMNMSFFSNISHEFRTPLTMISGPISMLNRDSSITGEHKHLLAIVYRSVNRMLRLVNQMMDFNKLDNDALKLNVKKCDIIHEVNSIIEIFRINAKEKGITLKTYGLEDSYYVLLDKDKLEKILENLLSNALKYTFQNGNITVSFDVLDKHQASTIFQLTDKDKSQQYVKISVEDDGIGIAEDKLNDVFQRYYQIEANSSQGFYNWGTGIGLYFAKRLVEMHHGYIKAVKKDNQGSLFVFILPANNEAYTYIDEQQQSENNDIPSNQHIITKFENTGDQDISSKDSDSSRKVTILVVDDDVEISLYLRSLLSSHYLVVNKYDGDSAYNSLDEISPDLIVSDVIMAGMTGYELCKKIKENISFCHIPIILLTAKNLIEERIEGLELGANAYVSKPFDPLYLQAVIKSQLKNRDLMRNMLSTSTQTSQIEQILSPQDEAFMKELYNLMEKELSNTELNISFIIDSMKISRTKLHYKIKGLTGESPNNFFKKYKLNRAAEFILTGNYNISEIADMTGFGTLSHFSVSFKKQFGVNPSDYK